MMAYAHLAATQRSNCDMSQHHGWLGRHWAQIRPRCFPLFAGPFPPRRHKPWRARTLSTVEGDTQTRLRYEPRKLSPVGINDPRYIHCRHCTANDRALPKPMKHAAVA
jgi:hypothetical protein